MSLLPQAPTLELPVVWYNEETPEVSIVILNYNKPQLTCICLEHLWAHTTGRRYEIIVVDNGSIPNNTELLRASKGPFRLVTLEVNRFFGEGNNIGAEIAKGTYIVFINNDAFVTEDWLDPLVCCMENEPLLGGVGPCFVYPDGRLQEAGAFVFSDGNVVQMGKLNGYTLDQINQNHIVDYISAACFLTRRDLFLSIGGFEYVYEPAYFEDIDLCLRIAARDLFIAYCAKSRVMHVEHATSVAEHEKLGLQSVMEINRAQFVRQWGEQLAAREQLNIVQRTLRPHFSSRPRAVFYTPYDLTPGGGERYILTAAAALVSDFDVYLATEETYSRVRLRTIGRDLALDLDGLTLVERRNLGQIGQIDISVLMCNEELPTFPGFGLRNLNICQFPFPRHWSENLLRYGNLDSYVETIVYSDFVRDHLRIKREALGLRSQTIEVIPPPVPLAPPAVQKAPLQPPYRLVLIGRFFTGDHNKRHDIAIEAVRRLVTSEFPVELDLIGSLSPKPDHRDHYMRLVSLAQGLPITFHPNASSASLNAILSRSHLYIHATGYGVDAISHPHECEHFGISIIEAMSYGLIPFVVANGGPVSFIHNRQTGYTYSTVDELVSKIKSVLSRPNEFEMMRVDCVALAGNYDERGFAQVWRARALKLIS